MPLPGSRVIHPRFSEHHRPVATGSMRARATITRASTGAGTFDPATLTTTPPAPTTVAASTPCRVQGHPLGDRVIVSGDQVLTVHAYLVTLPHDVAPVAIGDRVTITAADDTALVGRSLRVLGVAYGSEQWERDLLCEDNEG